MVAEDEEVLGQDDLADDACQKIVRKILKRREQDVEDAFDDVAAAVPIVDVDGLGVDAVFLVAETPRCWSLEQDFPGVVLGPFGRLGDLGRVIFLQMRPVL